MPLLKFGVQPVKVCAVFGLVLTVPRYIETAIEAFEYVDVKLFSMLPKASSTSTVGLTGKAVVGEELPTPVGSVTNANCVGAPGLLTAKALLIAGIALPLDPVGVAVAVMVYCISLTEVLELGL